MYITAVIIL